MSYIKTLLSMGTSRFWPGGLFMGQIFLGSGVFVYR